LLPFKNTYFFCCPCCLLLYVHYTCPLPPHVLLPSIAHHCPHRSPLTCPHLPPAPHLLLPVHTCPPLPSLSHHACLPFGYICHPPALTCSHLPTPAPPRPNLPDLPFAALTCPHPSCPDLPYPCPHLIYPFSSLPSS
jgi:hypothetical protein